MAMMTSLEEIGELRGKNLVLWNRLIDCIGKLALMKLALEANPESAKAILTQIADNDEKIAKATRRLLA